MLGIFKKKPKKNVVTSLSNISELVRKGNDLFSDELIVLDEKLSGNLYCAEKVAVEQNGALSGNITSRFCIVSGTINGNIVATEQMDIKSTARIKGDIRSALINIEPGAIINGCITIPENGHELNADPLAKIKESLADEYLGDKIAGLLAEINQNDTAVTIDTQVQQDAPIELIQKPVAAASPAPQKVADSEGANQRWW